MQTRAKWLALLVLITLSACGTPRRSAAELDTSRHGPRQDPAPQYPYTWRPRQLPREPACYDAAMCYDEKRDVCVLFGGSRKYGEEINLTFTWDGASWLQRDSWNRPAARSEHAMVYDPVSELVFLVAGQSCGTRLRDFWEWDGVSWRAGLMPLEFSARSGHAMAFDSKRGVVVLFGGSTGHHAYSNETWEYDGNTWTKRELPDSPPPRSHCGMAFDEKRQRMVMYGGMVSDSSGEKELGDTWEYDGEDWLQVMCEPEPGELSQPALVFDKAAQELVLISGGYAHGSVRNSDVWLFDGTGWTKKAIGEWPAPRKSCAVCFDSKRAALVVHGGWSWSHFAWNDTWELQNNRWSECQAMNTRPIRGWLVYDEARSKCVLVGMPVCGIGASRLMVWEWNGHSWLPKPTQSGPDFNMEAFCCYDAHNRVVKLFRKQFDGGDLNPYDAVWIWDGVAWRQDSSSPPLPKRVEALVYDARQQTMLAFSTDHDESGRSGYGSIVWTLSGNVWRRIDARDGPGSWWELQNCVFDSSSGETLFIGESSEYPDGKRRATTWRWNGTAWHKSIGAPDIAGGNVLVYDSVRQRVVCFGGGDVGEETRVCDATWEWDGGAWARVTPLQNPRARCNAMGAFDKERGIVVVFGGECNREALADTWEYGPDKP